MSARSENVLSLTEEDILHGGDGDYNRPAALALGEPRLSVIAKDVIFTGNIFANGCVQIEGNLQGNVRCKTLISGDDAVIKGEIRAESVVVGGLIEGPIKTLKLVVESGAYIKGDIEYRSIRIDSDAYVEGKFHQLDSKSTSSSADEETEASSETAVANVVNISEAAAPAVSGQIGQPTEPSTHGQAFRQADPADISGISDLAWRADFARPCHVENRYLRKR